MQDFGFRVTLLPGRLRSRGGAAVLVFFCGRWLVGRRIFVSPFAFGCVVIVGLLSLLLWLWGHDLDLMGMGMSISVTDLGRKRNSTGMAFSEV